MHDLEPNHAPDDSRPTTEVGVRWRDVAIFLLITFGVTWAIEGAALARGMRFDRLGAVEFALLASIMFVPAISAFIVRKFVTREGFATAGLRLGRPALFPLVWLGVPLLFGVIYLLSAALGLGSIDFSGRSGVEQLRQLAGPGLQDQTLPQPNVLLAVTLLASLTVGVLVNTIATFGEEFGWTGYLLPKLLPLGRWKAAVLYGTIWGLWHAPVIAAGYNYPGYPVAGIGLMVLFTISVALIQTALWLRSESVFLTSFFHASINTQARGVWPLVVTGVPPLLGGVLGLLGIAVFAAVGTWLLATAPVE